MVNGLFVFRGQRKSLQVAETLDYFFRSVPFLVIVLLFCFGCSTIDSSVSEQGPSPEMTPKEELESFILEPGLKIELVAAEPLVQDPVVFSFDRDGRLWVVEMRGYMPDIEGTGEREPVGRVSVLWDTDEDGMMDASSVYLDSRVMPRAVGVVGDGALVGIEGAVWMTKDLDGDLRADTKILIDEDYGNSPLPEHTANGLWRGIDNWYYNAKSRLRYQFVDGSW